MLQFLGILASGRRFRLRKYPSSTSIVIFVSTLSDRHYAFARLSPMQWAARELFLTCMSSHKHLPYRTSGF